MAILIFLYAHWSYPCFQTFFQHRYGSHKMFVLSRLPERFFYLMTFFFQGRSFLVRRAYAVLHRSTMRQRYRGRSAFSAFPLIPSGYVADKLHYAGLVRRTVRPPPEIAKDVPNGKHWIGSLTPYIRAWPGARFTSCFTGTLLHQRGCIFLLPVHFLMGVIHGAIVNWCVTDMATGTFYPRQIPNTLPIDFLMWRALPDNHHKNPNKAHFAVRLV